MYPKQPVFSLLIYIVTIHTWNSKANHFFNAWKWCFSDHFVCKDLGTIIQLKQPLNKNMLFMVPWKRQWFFPLGIGWIFLLGVQVSSSMVLCVFGGVFVVILIPTPTKRFFTGMSMEVIGSRSLVSWVSYHLFRGRIQATYIGGENNLVTKDHGHLSTNLTKRLFRFSSLICLCVFTTFLLFHFRGPGNRPGWTRSSLFKNQALANSSHES